MALLFAKLAVSIGVVLILSVLAERAGPRVAGVLSGYPLGTAILLYFIGVEQGVAFASESAVYALPGLIATLAFLYAYYLVSRQLLHQKMVWQLPLSSLAAFGAFLTVSWICQQISFNRVSGAIALLIAMGMALVLFRGIENVRILNRVRLTRSVVLFRAVLAALIVLGISGIAAWIGPKWAGLFSGFPVTLYPMMLILHVSYGVGPLHTVIRNFPRGMGALWIYILAVTVTYPIWGINTGTILSFAVATLYLIAYSTLVWMREKSVRA
ncbi:hypothetical protein [Thalassospira alkalitolerans]|uniref:Uncharacterized protein n=1 Tax=Thalassospira alkalitolerans TaxID=1293890 RepID=A0A1Y2L8T6_9PROT|nr:hypothetical protein [Thalassospira alkalitolerans]OSQ43190.1 hypothetical protein TALK_20735 [Thalassospira alkalitolerans]